MNAPTVTCDDCGLSVGINLAALELHTGGIATSASVMTNFPATPHALDLFRPYPALAVGVHLNLSEGFPLTRPRPETLTRADGRFRPAAGLFGRSLAAGPDWLAQVERELAAQIEVLTNNAFAPRHLTTHLHFHLLPPLRRIVCSLAERYRVPWVRPHRLRATVLPFNPWLDARLRAAPSDASPVYLAVVQHWLRFAPHRLARRLRALGAPVELVVHPCRLPDDTFPSGLHYGAAARAAEQRYLERLWPLLGVTGTS